MLTTLASIKAAKSILDKKQKQINAHIKQEWFGDEAGEDGINTDSWNVKFVDQQRVEYIPSVVQKIVPPAVFGQMVGLTKTSVERTLPILPENISEEIQRSAIIKPYRTLKIRRKADGK